jgi:hypothetical protein
MIKNSYDIPVRFDWAVVLFQTITEFVVFVCIIQKDAGKSESWLLSFVLA